MQRDQLLLKTFTDAAVITPADSDLARKAYALYIGTSGHVRVTTLDGTDVLFSNVPVGILDIAVKRVWSTNTTASTIVALYY